MSSNNCRPTCRLVILASENSDSLPENIAGEGHRVAGWGIGKGKKVKAKDCV